MTQKDSQEKLVQFRILEARLEGLIKHRDLVLNRMAEIENTIAGIDEISKAKGETKFYIGDGVFYPAKPVADDKLIVTIGADIALEKTVAEAKKLLEERMTEVGNAMRLVQREIDAMTKRLESMVPEIEAMHGH